jgi:hypothetical protein
MAKLELRNGRWHIIVNGQSVFNSSNKYYARSKMAAYESEGEEQESKAKQFPINDRFNYIGQIIQMIAKKQIPSMIITGPGGLGKTHSVMQGLAKAGLRDISELDIGTSIPGMTCFRIIKGFSTAKGLYRILFENQSNVVVFDDCDSVLTDPDALNLLKGALDSYDKRLITWNTSIDDQLPRSFVFKGAVIFISNKSQAKIGQALRTRSICVDLDMTNEQKLERMDVILRSEGFLPNIPVTYKLEALDLLKRNREACTDLSLRSLITVTKIRNSGQPNWEALATYVLMN